MKYGIIGYGKMGQIRHNAMQRVMGISPALVFDQNPALTIGMPTASSPQEVIAAPTLDAVVICTPNFMNKELTIAALQAGKHVFCEKPPGLNADQLREIRAVEDATNRVLMYGFNHRHHGGSRMIKDLVNGEEFGRVLWMRGRYGKSVDEDFFSTWRADPKLAGGGILLDQGIHMLDLFLQVGGNFDEIHAFVSSLYWKLPGIEDNVFAIMRNSETGMTASLHSTMTQWRHLFSFEVFLERGYMVLNGLKTPSGTYGAEELTVASNRSKAPAATWADEERHLFEVDDSWEREMRGFVETVMAGPSNKRDSFEALRVMEVIEKIYAHGHFVSETLHETLQKRRKH